MTCRGVDALRRRRPQIHFRIARQPRQQKGLSRHQTSVHTHRGTTRSNGQIRRRHGPYACRRERRRRVRTLSPSSLAVIVGVYNLYDGVVIVIRGTTLGCRITPPYIARNKHFSIVQSFKTSHPTRFHLHIPNCSSISTHQRKSSNGPKMPLRNVRRLSR